MELPSRFFVTAIGTDSGKTVASAILALRLNAAYWKPIQCGTPTDTNQLKGWLGNEWPIIPEKYRLQEPCSPHHAADLEGIAIHLKDFLLPQTDVSLVVEGAGGLMVPINQEETLADLMSHLGIPLILVINHYLGSLNHALLTLSEISKRKLPLFGLIFNGFDFQNSEGIIMEHARCPCLLRMKREEAVTSEVISKYASELKF